ncbi:hypothetical protein AVL61_00205 [Kocuria rosea subsp. polaris]|uniref:Uncharacterized protein n=1 Tax=Kocuria rosea subsp. polaris TaxID=136273 RepID=A0A0W8IP31_KOCRO|nr:hypothetical protein AVL61_00205 [Kocuria polaris]
MRPARQFCPKVQCPRTPPGPIVESIDRTQLPPRPPQQLDDRAVHAVREAVLHEEVLACRPARVDVVSGADPAVQGYRTACRELLERAGL